MKKKILFWVYFLLAIILAIYFATRIIMTLLGYSSNSYVKNISIYSASEGQDLSAIATAAAVAPGTKLYSINLEEINNRINSVPGVKESAVRKRPNGNLSVKVELYKAVALWTDGEKYFPLSADGTIVNKPTDVRTEGTVVFSGSVPKDISEITKAAYNLLEDLDYMEWVEDRRWNIHTTGGITILLPEKNPTDAIGSLLVLDKNHKILSKEIKILDLRDTSRILIKQ